MPAKVASRRLTTRRKANGFGDKKISFGIVGSVVSKKVQHKGIVSHSFVCYFRFASSSVVFVLNVPIS